MVTQHPSLIPHPSRSDEETAAERIRRHRVAVRSSLDRPDLATLLDWYLTDTTYLLDRLAEHERADHVPGPHAAGSETSRRAAPTGSERRQKRSTILAAIRVSGTRGMTCDAVEERLGWTHQTVSARINELHRDGLIAKSGTRLTRSRRQATIWVVV